MRSAPSPGSDHGAAIVETVLVMVVLLAMSLGIVQLALVGHVRGVLAASAAEGARRGGETGSNPASGAALAEQIADGALGVLVTCTGAVETDAGSGLSTVVVRCASNVRTTVLPVGSVRVSASGRALREGA
jgi:Flp pilus assembly protein TadG